MQLASSKGNAFDFVQVGMRTSRWVLVGENDPVTFKNEHSTLHAHRVFNASDTYAV